jgi:hypothetical protein
MGSLVQIAGAILVLVAYGLLQAGVLTAQARSFILLNLIGASILAVEAYIEEQWGFLMLEAVWAAIAAWSLVRLGNRDADIAKPSY